MKIRITLALALLMLALGCLFTFAPEEVGSGQDSGVDISSDHLLAANTGKAPASEKPATKESKPAQRTSKALLVYVPKPAWASGLEAGYRAPTREIHYVRLDRDLLFGKKSPLWAPLGKGTFALTLPDGTTLNARIEQSVMHDESRWSSFASVDDKPGARVLLSGNNGGQVTGSILDVPLGEGASRRLANFALRATGGAEAQLFEVDDSLVGQGGDRIVLSVEDKARALAAARQSSALRVDGTSDATGSTTEQPVAADATTSPVVDVMFLYTDAVHAKHYGSAAEKESAVVATLDNVIATVNSDFSRSQIDVTVRLVKHARVAHSEANSNADQILHDALSKMLFGTIEGVHTMRDTYGADLVCLALGQANSGGAIGLGYQMSDATVTDTRESRLNDLYGYTAVEYDMITSSNVVSHEMGHNFGCQHDRENAQNDDGTPSEGVFSYSYGYRFRGIDGIQYRTIMAYQPGARVNYFSNPDVTASESWVGVPVGVAEDQAKAANNAKTIRRTAFEVAAFRKQQVTPANGGRLLGLSTRAFVGKDEQQLIAGIIVTGNQAKNVLVRATGPSLGDAVPDLRTVCLADPKLTLYQLFPDKPAALIAQNSGWRLHASSSQVSAAGFAPASDLEAAMVLTLPPGAYSANVESDNAGTGIGLIEAYELASDATVRLTAISTRGYAETRDHKQLIAGLAVRGTAGQHKRIIIRVQGPTLARDNGIKQAMDDPYLMLHASDGTLLMANDDWALGAVYVNGVRDDFQPTSLASIDGAQINVYSGTAITQTGLAPKNRREPALLVDLLPGNYTVVIQPFENLSDPNDLQPGEPGVAIVEVYEIKNNGTVSGSDF